MKLCEEFATIMRMIDGDNAALVSFFIEVCEQQWQILRAVECVNTEMSIEQCIAQA